MFTGWRRTSSLASATGAPLSVNCVGVFLFCFFSKSFIRSVSLIGELTKAGVMNEHAIQSRFRTSERGCVCGCVQTRRGESF